MTPAMHVDAFSMGGKIFARRNENSKCNASDAYFGERDQRFRLNVISGSD
ncbi:hypothetical protein [Burkholderia glumae]|nr:hypothetical protein [Burkholderia glumae]